MKAARNYYDFFNYADGIVLSTEGLYAQTKNHYGEMVEVEHRGEYYRTKQVLIDFDYDVDDISASYWRVTTHQDDGITRVKTYYPDGRVTQEYIGDKAKSSLVFRKRKAYCEACGHGFARKLAKDAKYCPRCGAELRKRG